MADRIHIDKKICNGKPVINGTRISVQIIMEFLNAGDSQSDILKQYPKPGKADIQAAIQFTEKQKFTY